MLRPATPLSILLFISFVLLLISVLSTPIVKGIPLARFEGVNFGVFGWCKDDGTCSPITVGWNTDEALPASDDAEFNLPSSARHSLSSLLIVHPIAALCNLIVLCLAIAAHFHSPSHSARYLLGVLILLLPTLLVTLLAFLVDILLFVPHLQWGGWIVLASTILITASGVVTCAMRRTLVSRKARKKRIAENAEMSGANFYARQEEESRMMPLSATESKSPMVNGAPGSDALPAFNTYSSRRSDDRPSAGPISTEPVTAVSPIDTPRYYTAGPRSRSTSRPRPDEFGAPLGARSTFDDRSPVSSNPNRGAYGPPRGRGSFASRGRPYGPARGRGGYPPGLPSGPAMPSSAMMPDSMNYRPPPGYGPRSPGAYDAVRSGDSNLPSSSFQPTTPSAYSTDPTQSYGPAYGARAQSPAQRRQSPYSSRTQSPAGVRPPQQTPPAMPPMPDHMQYSPVNHQRSALGMDSDVLGMVEMQRVHPQRHTSQPSSPLDYTPARAGWSDPTQPEPRSPVGRKRMNSGGSDYLEDVDPKFAEPTIPLIPTFDHPHNQPQHAIPSLLMPGRNPHDPSPESSSSHIQIPHTASYDDLQAGARSPVESETSNFTSVSQRPMNPNWQPGHGGEFNSFGPGPHPDRRQQQRKQDAILSNNPDFELPGMSGPRRGDYRGRGAYRGGRAFGGSSSAYRGPMRPPPPSVLDNLTGPDSRYPPAPGTQISHGGGSMREI